MHEPHPLHILLSRMHKPCPMQSCLVTNENEIYEVEKLSSTSPLLLPLTRVTNSSENCMKLFITAKYSLLKTERTRVMHATSLLIKF